MSVGVELHGAVALPAHAPQGAVQEIASEAVAPVLLGHPEVPEGDAPGLGHRIPFEMRGDRITPHQGDGMLAVAAEAAVVVPRRLAGRIPSDPPAPGSGLAHDHLLQAQCLQVGLRRRLGSLPGRLPHRAAASDHPAQRGSHGHLLSRQLRRLVAPGAQKSQELPVFGRDAHDLGVSPEGLPRALEGVVQGHVVVPCIDH